MPLSHVVISISHLGIQHSDATQEPTGLSGYMLEGLSFDFY